MNAVPASLLLDRLALSLIRPISSMHVRCDRRVPHP
jgi:hypothetical protein